MAPRPISENTLFYDDNLYILREYIPSESVDLICLEPSLFNSNHYYVLFLNRSKEGTVVKMYRF